MSLDLPLPKLLVTGWLLKDGHKMSKSLGNVVTVDQILHYGGICLLIMFIGLPIRGRYRQYMEILFERYNSDLANGIGNLLARTLTMVEKYFAKSIPKFNKEFLLNEQIEIVNHCEKKLFMQLKKAFDQFRIADALNDF